MADLTGNFDTTQLPRIAPGSVTVTIARRIIPGREGEFMSWCTRMLETVRHAPGCLGATNLNPGIESDEYQMVFRFVDAIHLRRWERSDEREQLLDEVEPLLKSSRVTVTAGTDEFFDAQTASEHPRYKSPIVRFVRDLAWVYPITLFVAVGLAPHLARFTVWQRALLTTAFVGATSQLASRPIRQRIEKRRRLPQGATRTAD